MILQAFVAGVLADTKRTRKRKGRETTEGSVDCPADATAKSIRPAADSRR